MYSWFIGLAKKFIWVFHKMLWKNPNERFGQLNIMVCQSLLYSKSDSILHVYIIHVFWNILFHYGLSQETGYSFLQFIFVTPNPVFEIYLCCYIQLQFPQSKECYSQHSSTQFLWHKSKYFSRVFNICWVIWSGHF